MTPGDKRMIIDKIFSLEVLNKVYELIKKDMRDLGNTINLNNSQIFALEQTIKTSNAELLQLENTNKNENKDTLAELEERTKNAASLHAQVSKTYQDVYEEYVKVCTAESQLNQLKTQHVMRSRQIESQIKLFNADKCPTCGTSFNSDEFIELKKTLEASLDKEKLFIQDTDEKLANLANTKSTYTTNLQTLKGQLDKIVEKQNQIFVEIKSIENAASKTTEFQSIQNIISETEKSKRTLEDNIAALNEKMSLMTVMETMYSSDGIKKQMMENYIPTLNEEIKNTLIALSFPYTLEFDNNFDPHLECLGEPIEVQSLSTGEHKKVDLTVLCAILRMLKRKYPQINLVCLDETLSSLDYESSTDIITYLLDIASNMCLNIFIVSHTQLDENLFNVRIHIDKNSGFSDLTYL
jgi:DNA repair exonuclease SbcCD ATPase subunit